MRMFSVPKDGNIKYENFEDDTDKAPNIRLILYRDPDGNITVRMLSKYMLFDLMKASCFAIQLYIGFDILVYL